MDVLEDATILQAVWAMKCKRRITTQEVYHWKACLNIDGSKQEKGVNYWDTYAPVTSGAKLTISVKGDLADFLGVNIELKPDGTVHLTQPLLIDHILQDLRLIQLNTASQDKPAKSGQLLRCDLHKLEFNGHSDY